MSTVSLLSLAWSESQLKRKYYIINSKNVCLSPSIKTFIYIKFQLFLMENNCNITYEGVDDVNTHETVFFQNQRTM